MAKLDKHKTKVIFRISKHGVVAVFPELPGTTDPGTCTVYAHIGQHSSGDCMNTAAWGGRIAKPSEYAALARELKNTGYNLKVVKRATRGDYETRKREIRR